MIHPICPELWSPNHKFGFNPNSIAPAYHQLQMAIVINSLYSTSFTQRIPKNSFGLETGNILKSRRNFDDRDEIANSYVAVFLWA